MFGCLELVENQMHRIVVQTIDEVNSVHGKERRMNQKRKSTKEWF